MTSIKKLAMFAIASSVVSIVPLSLAEVPMTAWGKPDLQGNWDFRSITPFQRPASLKDKEFLTKEEIAAYEEARRKGKAAYVERTEGEAEANQGDVDVGYNAGYIDTGEKMTGNRTSLVVDPPNGRKPSMKQKAIARMGELRKHWERAPHGPEDRNQFDRCLMGFNAGPPMSPGAYNNMMVLVQTEDYIAIETEMVNDHRIFPTNGGDPLPDNMRLWKGDSHGVWEGDTFVVTTTNFNHLQMYHGTGMNMQLIERFTRLDEDTLEYRFTVTDSDTYDVPWTAVLEMELTKDDLFEYACHEGNYAMPLMLKGARKQDREGTEDDTWLPSWSK